MQTSRINVYRMGVEAKTLAAAMSEFELRYPSRKAVDARILPDPGIGVNAWVEVSWVPATDEGGPTP